MDKKEHNGRQVRTFVNTSISSSKKDGSSNGDDRKDKDKEETINKLNALLKVMVEEDSSKVLTASQSLELAKPKKRFNKKSEQNRKDLGIQLKDAANDVAKAIGGNTQETEMELLGKLLGIKSTASANLNELLSGMKVEQKPTGEMSRAQQVRSSLERGSPRQTKNFEHGSSFSEQLRTESHIKLRKRVGVYVDIFGAEPSNYFADIKPNTDIPKMETWENCLNRELRLSVTHPPSNIYEQIMIWTDRGIFWKFPIDNEQGLEDEKQVSFEEHIFLETHLEGWCPEKGPIKHFMELVIVGLSKNFWMTAEEKKQHIFWYRDYFKDKNTLLQELGAGNIGEAEAQNENAA